MSSIIITPTDEQEKIVVAFLNALDIPFINSDRSKTSEQVMDIINESRRQAENGQFITHEEFLQRLSLPL